MHELEQFDPRRKEVRLPGYDYSTAGAYFVTICCGDLKSLFGRVVDGHVQLNELGQLAAAGLERIGERANAIADTFVVMPNHIHAIIFIDPERYRESLQNAGRSRATPTPELPTIALPTLINLYKQWVTKEIRLLLGDPQIKVWQRGYYEHIVRDEDDLNIRRNYILTNPQRWMLKRA